MPGEGVSKIQKEESISSDLKKQTEAGPRSYSETGLSWDSYSDHDLSVSQDLLKDHLEALKRDDLDPKALKTILEVYKTTPDKISQTLEKKIKEGQGEMDRRAQAKK